LLGLNGKADATPEMAVSSRGQTPETYLGSARAARFASPEKLADGATIFSLPKFLPIDHWALSGKWHIEGERIIASEVGAKLQLNFTAGKVFLVLGAHDGNPVKAKLTLNGEPVATAAGKDAPDGILTVAGHTLYELINQGEVKNGLLEINVENPGLEAYAFTFGS
jgi:hypothetical protein